MKWRIIINEIINIMLVKAAVPILMMVLGYIAGRYLKPWIYENESRLARAHEIALIADRITDEIRLLAPNARWSEWIDEGIDRLIHACKLEDNDVNRAMARRELAKSIIEKNMQVMKG